MRDFDDDYWFFEDYLPDVRGPEERPGTYWARPSRALTASDQLTPGEIVWKVYLWSKNEAPRSMAVTFVGSLVECNGGDTLASDLLGGRWFKCEDWNGPHSCNDCSLDGADYNNNYLFATQADALDAIANKQPRGVPA